jgi:all-trans-retinol dehydrogenase (NAD+)
MTQIAGSTILITGGASGIGRRLALKTAALGAKVVVWDIHADRLAAVIDELNRSGAPGARGYLCDVSDRRCVYETAERVKREAGPVRILVNGAGIVSGKRFLECGDADIQRTIEVNIGGLFWTCKAFLPDMIDAGAGHVVTIASAAGMIGVARLADYCASKWAAVGLDESLRMELRHQVPGVRTTIVCPYYIDTGMFRGVATRFPWLLPILKEEKVAERIVRAVARNRRRLVMPWLVWSVPLLRILPVGMFDALADLLGINRSMDRFEGRTRVEELPVAANPENSP